MSRRTRVRQAQRVGRLRVMGPRAEHAWGVLMFRRPIWEKVLGHMELNIFREALFRTAFAWHKRDLEVFRLVEGYCLRGGP
jgi:hypothetical protein